MYKCVNFAPTLYPISTSILNCLEFQTISLVSCGLLGCLWPQSRSLSHSGPGIFCFVQGPVSSQPVPGPTSSQEPLRPCPQTEPSGLMRVWAIPGGTAALPRPIFAPVGRSFQWEPSEYIIINLCQMYINICEDY